MKNKSFLILVILIILTLSIEAIIYNFNASKPITTNLNEEFILNKNQIATMTNGEDKITLTLTGFANSPAPEGSTPIWSGLAVYYKLQVNENIYVTTAIGVLPDNENLKYAVEVIDTDYAKYAKFKVTLKEVEY